MQPGERGGLIVPCSGIHPLVDDAALHLLYQQQNGFARGIVHKRMNPTARHNEHTPLARLQAHMLATARKVHAYIHYLGTSNYNEAALLMNTMMEKEQERIE